MNTAARVSEIFLGNEFEFRSKQCKCYRDVQNLVPGEDPITTLKLVADETLPLLFSYVRKDGLDLTGENGGVIDRNILGKLLTINDDKVDGYINFIENYGFFFPISSSEYESIDSKTLIEIVNRVKATLRLMNALGGAVDHRSILINATYLLYAKPIEICLSTGNYRSYRHPYSVLIDSYDEFPDMERNRDVFNSGCLNVPDTILNRKNSVDASFINAVRSGDESGIAGSKSIEYKHLLALYLNYDYSDLSLRKIIDFYFHYQTEIGVIKDALFKRLTFYSKPNESIFSEEMKTALVDIAKNVLSSEINHNIQGIHLRYDGNTLTPVWQVDSLLQALYFSIFYMKPGIQVYKQCANPNCKRSPYFLTKGNTSWPKTIREQMALIQKNGSLIFTNMTVRTVTPNANKQITQIHRYCVYEAFEKMGWVYVPYMPAEPGPHPSTKESIYILNRKLAETHNDIEQELFSAMRDMLVYIDTATSEKQYFFGTDFFDRVWEKMIDRAFGIEGKESFFPRTRWLLDYGRIKDKHPLIPDSIMIYNGRCYVLDAKLYRYGWDANPDHLPNGSDINKQITYGEYIERTTPYSGENLYNAFVMPYNMMDNLFNISGRIENIGEAVGQWKANYKYYERIQGILIDTRYLMYNYLSMSNVQKEELAVNVNENLSQVLTNI